MSGLYTALLLAKKGHHVTVIEKRPDPRTTSAYEGRSINFTLSLRGLTALERVGLRRQSIERAVEVKERLVHLSDGRLSRQTYGNVEGTGLYSISRRELNLLLLDAVSKTAGIELLFDTAFTALDKATPSITLQSADASGRTLMPDYIIGADGAFSAVRRTLQNGELADYQQEFFGWVYKEFTLSKEEARALGLTLNGVHVWPRDIALLLGLPNSNGSLTCNLLVPRTGPFSGESMDDQNSLAAFLLQNFSELQPYFPTICSELLEKEWSGIMTMKTDPWHYQDKVVLVGDAAHAVVHFYAQGLNASLEDCVTLVERLNEHPVDRETAFREYVQARKPNTDLLAELSKQNFQTLSSHAASPFYEARALMETWLGEAFPQLWRSSYSMIAHSVMPYVQAARITQTQNRFWGYSGLWIAQLFFGSYIWISRKLTRIFSRRSQAVPQASLREKEA